MSEERGRKKDRLLFILRYLINNTDDDHRISQNELFNLCVSSDHGCDRHAISNDIRVLCSYGFDIIQTKIGTRNYYNYGCREFDTAELRTLMDAVVSCKSISQRKTECLIKKISKLTSCHDAKMLQSSLYTGKTEKADNNQIFLTVDVINQAINTCRKISFQPFSCSGSRRATIISGKACTVSPYMTVWKNDRYYMIGWSDNLNTVSAYPIDQMNVPVLLDEPGMPKPNDFDVENSLGSVADSCNGGSEMEITLKCDNDVMSQVMIHFGSGLQFERADESHFRTRVHVHTGDIFWGWLFENVGRMRIEAPREAKLIYRERLNRALSE